VNHSIHFPFSFFGRPKPKDLKLTAKITVEHSCSEDSTDVSFRDLKREIRSRMAVDGEDLSDSGIEKACDDAVPSSPRVPPDGADYDEIQIEQLRPHNRHQQLSIKIPPEKCQTQQQAGTNGNVNFLESETIRISRLNSQQCPDQLAQQEHHSTVPFSNNTYAAFKKGNVVRGILCPSLTNSFR
jgi:hypothetical protein